MTQWPVKTSGFLRQAQQVGLGVSLFADLVKPTLGPKGRAVTISTPDGQLNNTKHGLLIADSMNPEDPWQAKGVAMIKAAAGQTGDFGDAASTIAVLAQSMLDNAEQAVAQGIDPRGLKRGIDEAIKAVLREIKKLAHSVSSTDQIVSVGTILADGDADVGVVVGQVFTDNPHFITVNDPRGPSLMIDYEPRFHFHDHHQAGTLGHAVLPRMQQGSFLTLDKSDDGTVIVSVNGDTEVDRSERLWRVKSALQATLAALKDGFVPGGGAALLHASKALTKMQARSAAHQRGIDIVRAALRAPLRQIVDNAGVDGAKVVNSLMRRKNAQVGYDVQTDSYTDMVDAGIIDPLTVVTSAVEGAGSIASAIVGAPTITMRSVGSYSMKAGNPYMRYFLPDSDLAYEGAGGHLGHGGGGGWASPKAATTLQSGGDGGGQAASGEPETTTQPQNRFLVGEFPERVAVGQSSILNVFVSPSAGNRSAPFDAKVPKGGLNIEIFVEVEVFDLSSPARAPLLVPEQGESGIAGFKLKAKEAPAHAIHISALAEGATVGGLSFEVKVDQAAGAPSPPRSERAEIDAPASEDGSIAIVIQQDPSTHQYSFSWLGKNDTRETVYQNTPFEELDDFIGKRVNDVQELVREKYDLDPAVVHAKLRARGISWWEKLIPQQIRDWYIQDHDKIKRINIISAGDPIPWEALYPFRDDPGFDRGFLVEQVKISRWRFGPSAPSAISVCRADFVFPNDGLEGAETEVDRVLELLSKCYDLKGERIDNQTLLFKLFITASASLLHFACHNSFEKGGRIAVQPSSIEPEDFVGYKGKLKASAPLIFLNACRTDGKDVQYTGLGGWAKTFLSIGAGAFIGTHWEVRDTSAQHFAEVLYRALVEERKCFGEALDDARNAIKSPGDPTWLAYTFYGDHRARVKKGVGPAPMATKPEPTFDPNPT